MKVQDESRLRIVLQGDDTRKQTDESMLSMMLQFAVVMAMFWGLGLLAFHVEEGQHSQGADNGITEDGGQ